MTQTHCDVIIIGAGAAGIKAGLELQKSGKAVCIIEANDRIGGRIKSGVIAGHTVDLGAGWINPEQRELHAEIQAHQTALNRQFTQGNSILDLNHSLSYFNSEQFGLTFLANFALNRALHTLEHNAMTVPVESPWTCDNALLWDSQTLQNWINNHIRNPVAKSYFETSVKLELAIEPSKISYLYFLQLVHADLIAQKTPAGVEGAWSHSVVGGMYGLIQAMAQPLVDRITLSQPIVRVKQTATDVTAYSETNAFTGQYCIVAIPPTQASNIHFDPEFSAKRYSLFQSMPMGSSIKSFIAYSSPFWRDNDMSGITINNTSPFSITMDASPESLDVGLITAISCGNEALDFCTQSVEDRKKALVKLLVQYFGKKAEDPIDYIDTSWATQRWSRCGFSGYLPPGMITSLKGEISFPSHRVHWAGTETATQWHGSVEGAIQSGIRAANEVLQELLKT